MMLLMLMMLLFTRTELKASCIVYALQDTSTRSPYLTAVASSSTTQGHRSQQPTVGWNELGDASHIDYDFTVLSETAGRRERL